MSTIRTQFVGPLTGNTTPIGAVSPTLMDAQATTSGTSITFSSIPSWAKRITVIFNGVSTNGVSNLLVQVGSGSITSTGYQSVSLSGPGGSSISSTAGHIIYSGNAGNILYGHMTLTLVSGNTWVSSHLTGDYLSTFYVIWGGGGSPNLSGALDRIVLTTVNGTDTFDAGSISVMYE